MSGLDRAERFVISAGRFTPEKKSQKNQLAWGVGRPRRHFVCGVIQKRLWPSWVAKPDFRRFIQFIPLIVHNRYRIVTPTGTPALI